MTVVNANIAITAVVTPDDASVTAVVRSDDATVMAVITAKVALSPLSTPPSPSTQLSTPMMSLSQRSSGKTMLPSPRSSPPTWHYHRGHRHHRCRCGRRPDPSTVTVVAAAEATSVTTLAAAKASAVTTSTAAEASAITEVAATEAAPVTLVTAAEAPAGTIIIANKVAPSPRSPPQSPSMWASPPNLPQSLWSLLPCTLHSPSSPRSPPSRFCRHHGRRHRGRHHHLGRRHYRRQRGCLPRRCYHHCGHQVR